MNLQVTNALNTVNNLIPVLEEAESQFKSARNWSVIDVLGGGFITDIFKHHKLNQAQDSMNRANYLLQQLNYELGQINIPSSMQVQFNGFLTFADFFFDGIFVDAYMASKIMSSLDQVRQLKNKLYMVKSQLEQMSY